MRVVDLGAGTGVITGALAAQAGSVLAVEIDPRLAAGLARRFDRRAERHRAPRRRLCTSRCRSTLTGSSRTRRSATPPRSCADSSTIPAGGLVRADLVVQWQVARHRARVGEARSDRPARGDLGALVDLRPRSPAPGGRLPPPPVVDAAVLVITARPSPLLAPADFARYTAFVTANWTAGWAGRTEPVDWAARFRARR